MEKERVKLRDLIGLGCILFGVQLLRLGILLVKNEGLRLKLLRALTKSIDEAYGKTEPVNNGTQ